MSQEKYGTGIKFDGNENLFYVKYGKKGSAFSAFLFTILGPHHSQAQLIKTSQNLRMTCIGPWS